MTHWVILSEIFSYLNTAACHCVYRCSSRCWLSPFKALHGLRDCFLPVVSSDRMDMVQVPSTKEYWLVETRRCAFSAIAPALWNGSMTSWHCHLSAAILSWPCHHGHILVLPSLCRTNHHGKLGAELDMPPCGTSHRDRPCLWIWVQPPEGVIGQLGQSASTLHGCLW